MLGSNSFAALSALYAILLAGAEAQSRSAAPHSEHIRALSDQLQWRDEAGHEKYDQTKQAVTGRLLAEIDGFIAEHFRPTGVAAGSAKASLDALLGYRTGDARRNIAFLADLPGGRFLILGIEVKRGGAAIPEDAIFFRAYGAVGGQLMPIAAISGFQETGSGSPFLSNLHAEKVPAPPGSTAFWFVTWADIPPKAPPTVAIRVYAFDGLAFHAIWVPPDIVTQYSSSAVEVGNGGFVVNRLSDPLGCTIVHDEYALTSTGPQKSAEWETQCQ